MDTKNQAAQELARLRWAKLTPEEKSQVMRTVRLKGLLKKKKK
jgi:predicted Fe-S protein YdhL (DUF1289 family)